MAPFSISNIAQCSTFPMVPQKQRRCHACLLRISNICTPQCHKKRHKVTTTSNEASRHKKIASRHNKIASLVSATHSVFQSPYRRAFSHKTMQSSHTLPVLHTLHSQHARITPTPQPVAVQSPLHTLDSQLHATTSGWAQEPKDQHNAIIGKASSARHSFTTSQQLRNIAFTTRLD